MNTIGEKIAQLRKQKGMTQEELASIIGVSSQSVSKWENSTTMPDIMLLPVIADALESDINTLFGKETDSLSLVTAENAFEHACDSLLSVTMSACNDHNTADFSFDESFEKFRDTLKHDNNMRTAIIRKQGVLYYRDEVGGLLLKKPQNGWNTLLNNKAARNILTLLGDELFCTALCCIIKSSMTTFTISSLCSMCGIEQSEELERTIRKCDLFRSKKNQC